MPSRRTVVAAATIAALTLAGQPVVSAQPIQNENPATFATTILDRTGNVAQPGDRCPEVTLVIARGSDQNDQVEPQLYSDDAVRMSNGYEGMNFRNMLHQTEALYKQRTGQSLMANVDVLPLNGSIYPASLGIPAIAKAGEELGILETIKRIFQILIKTPLHLLIRDIISGFFGGLSNGRTSTPEYLAAYERQIGCTPQYILMGYSQGAMVLNHVEKSLADTGKLKGVFYMGNPLMGTNSVRLFTTTRIGHRGNEAGLLGWLPKSKQPQSARTDHVELCTDGDFACDTTPSSIATSLSSVGGQHAEYYLDTKAFEQARNANPEAYAPVELTYRSHTADEKRAMDELIRMITK